MKTSSRDNNVHRGRPAWTRRHPRHPRAAAASGHPDLWLRAGLPSPAAGGRRAGPRAVASRPGRSCQMRPALEPLGTAVADVVGCSQGPARTSDTSRARGMIWHYRCLRLAPPPESLTCWPNKCQDCLGLARNSIAEMARGDIPETDFRGPQKSTVSVLSR